MKIVLKSVAAGALMLGAGAFAADNSHCDNANVGASMPTSAFEIASDGSTVTHLTTGLMWARCALGQSWNGSTCSGSATTYTWSNALQAAADLNSGGGYAGYTDWRLPNIKELASIVERCAYDPAVNPTVFPGTYSGAHWTSTPDVNNAGYANMVQFQVGNDYSFVTSNTYAVRLVRGGY